MKKFILAVCTAVILVSCGKQPDGPYGFGGGFKMGTAFEFTAKFPADARSAILGNSWADGDRVFLFLKDITTGYLLMVYHEETSSFSVEPRGSLEMKDMLYNGRKIAAAVFLRQASDVTASYADGKWSFSPVRNLPFFTMGESSYTFNQDGYGNYTFSGTIDGLSTGQSWSYLYCSTVYVEEPEDEKYYQLSEETMQPVPGIEAVGTDGTVYLSKKEKGDGMDGLIVKKDKKTYRVYLGIHHDAIKTRIDGVDSGYGHLFLMNYGDHSLAHFEHVDNDFISNPSFALPKRPSASSSGGNGWWPFIAHNNNYAKESGVPINGVTWATQNAGANYPWEEGEQSSYKNALNKVASGWRLPSTEKKDFTSLTIGTTLYWTYVHGTPGYIVMDSKNKADPFIFIPTNSSYALQYWGDTHTWTEGEGEDAKEKMQNHLLHVDAMFFKIDTMDTYEYRDGTSLINLRAVKD